jgi:hypothetical protein
MSRLGEVIQERALRKLFDRTFYLRTNPDVAAAGVDPLRHYLTHGAAEQRQPHPLFDPAYYLACCPEARDAENPLLCFLKTSLKTSGGKWPSTHPLFDCEAYLSAHPNATGNPLVHYLAEGEHAGLEGSQFGQC